MSAEGLTILNMSSPVLLLVVATALGAAFVALLWMRDRQSLVRATARLEAERDAALRAVNDQRALLTQTQAQVHDAFAALSREALKENQADFFQTADGLFGPVLETLEKVRTQLSEVDKAREGSFRAVSSQLHELNLAQQQLRATAEGLSQSLRSPNVRGKWGEVQLRRILELAGMLEQCDFVEKETGTTSDGGRQTPDLIVKLPGGSNIVIDSKVPIDAYLAAANAKSDSDRQDHLSAHARQVREHVRALAAKEYWRQFQPSPEFVVMFMPLEPLLSAAFEHDGTLLEQAVSLRVIPATPMTLLALLKAVAYGWQQQAVAANTEAIQKLGQELYLRLGDMIGNLEAVGGRIGQAADSYNRLIGSLEHRVLPSARRFRDLGVSAPEPIGSPLPLGTEMRRVRREELTSPGSDSRESDVREAETEAPTEFPLLR